MTLIKRSCFFVLRCILTAALVLCLSPDNLFGQADLLSSAFLRAKNTELAERVYLHTDREAYLAGEILWFKAYVMEPAGKLSDLSKVLYVEIVDAGEKPLLQARISLSGGSGNGSFYLPASVKTANYQIRAYTSLMKNRGADCYFAKDVLLVNSFQEEAPEMNKEKTRYDAEFFPEGGYLLENKPSRIGFRVSGPDKKGVNFDGFVLDSRGDTVARFSPQKFGMGSFSIIPSASAGYKAYVRPAGGSPFSVAFPLVHQQGYKLELKGLSEGKLNFRVQAAGSSSSSVVLLGHSRNKVHYSAMHQLDNGETGFSVDTALLDAGITCFTLFDERKRPVSERLYFRSGDGSRTKLALDINRKEFAPRERVSLSLSTFAEKDMPVAADLSLAVYYLPANLNIQPSDIRSYLLLTSELKGNVESPESYFSASSVEAAKLIDNLMLCSGWKSEDWQSILDAQNRAQERYLPEHEGHLVSARLSDSKTGRALPGTACFLSVPGKRVQFFTAQSDEHGLLRFNTRELYGLSELIFQPSPDSSKAYRIDLLNPFDDHYTKASGFLHKQFDTETIADMAKLNLNMQVMNAFVPGKLRELKPFVADSSAFFGKPVKSYLLDDYTRFATTEEVLREYIPEIWLRRRSGELQLAVVEARTRTLFNSEPLMMLDGVPFSRSSKILKYDPLKVKAIDIVTNRYFFGTASFDGIVNFRTYNGNLDGYELDPGDIVIDYEGLLEERRFYSPDYSDEARKSSPLPDFRNLLFWSGNISTDAMKGSTRLEFFTSDQKGQYVGSIQGVAADGTLLHEDFHLEVK